ncbi:MAG: hypothetical protein J0M13_05205 [Candidatus Accumulibacter sp.]|nr:hypothetical protein [Candidatus Accumulibacter necessarius]
MAIMTVNSDVGQKVWVAEDVAFFFLELNNISGHRWQRQADQQTRQLAAPSLVPSLAENS